MLESRDVQCHTFVVTEIYANEIRDIGENRTIIYLLQFLRLWWSFGQEFENIEGVAKSTGLK